MQTGLVAGKTASQKVTGESIGNKSLKKLQNQNLCLVGIEEMLKK